MSDMSVGPGKRVTSIRVSKAINALIPGLHGVAVELYETAEQQDPLTATPCIISPFLAGKLAASAAQICKSLGPQALSDYLNGITAQETQDCKENT